MFKHEYMIYIGEKTYSFYKENESDTILKRNMQSDILAFAKEKKIETGDLIVEVTILYNEEYYDFDSYNLVIDSNYETLNLLSA